jgi:hypothetical protein
MQAAFAVRLGIYGDGKKEFLSYEGALHLPVCPMWLRMRTLAPDTTSWFTAKFTNWAAPAQWLLCGPHSLL